MKKRNKIIGGIVVVALLLVMVPMAIPSSLEVELVEVRRGSMEVVVQDQGRTRPRDNFTVAAPITGRLSRPSVDEGDSVSAGDTLFTVAPPPEDSRAVATYRAQLRAAEAGLNQAEASLEEARLARRQAEAEFERRTRLRETGSLTDETVERYRQAAVTARARETSAESAVRAASAGVEAAAARLLGAGAETGGRQGLVVVRAPTSGTVMRVLEESERVVAAGTPLLEVADANGMEIVVDILTEEAVDVVPGTPLFVTGWGGADTVRGNVRLVEPAAFTKVSALGVEEQRVNVIGDLSGIPPGLGMGYRVDVGLVTWRGQEVMSIPTAAAFRSGREWVVFVRRNGRARIQAITVGHRSTDRMEVLSGLDVGDMVVNFPSDEVVDGARISSQN